MLAKFFALGFALFAFAGAMAVAVAPGKLAETFACRSDPDGSLLVDVPEAPRVGSPVKAFVALKSQGFCFAPVERISLRFALLRDGVVVAEDAAGAALEPGTTIPPLSSKDPIGALYRAGVPQSAGEHVLFVESEDPPWKGATRLDVR